MSEIGPILPKSQHYVEQDLLFLKMSLSCRILLNSDDFSMKKKIEHSRKSYISEKMVQL
jgi:hypothetical protein